MRSLRATRVPLIVAAALVPASAADAQRPASEAEPVRPPAGFVGAERPRRAGEAAARRVEATRAATPPRIDGRLDDPAWHAAEATGDFVQMGPNPGAPASRPTEARVLYDDEALYVALRLHDHPDSVTAQLARRDASGVVTDWAHVLVDGYRDRRTAFRFSVSPHGTRKDVLHFDDSREDVNWDAVWEVGTRVDSLGWVAEFRIPLSQLRFSEGGAGLWGVNFGREIARLGEMSWWSPILPQVAGMVSQSGDLAGLAGLEQPRRLEALPYTVGRVTRAPGERGDPFWEATERWASAGLDLRYGLGPSLTLNATFNPDFGQVEADPSVVNLSAFESFFPEKRPFFLEGSNLFEFGVGYDDGSGEQLFYSRRVGRAPQRSLEGDFVDSPETTTILGAGKLSGRVGGWSVGVLNAVTAAEEGRVAAAGAEALREPVEPLTNYAVASLARDFRGGASTVRALVTATHRRLDDDDLAFLRSAAYSGGVHARHRFAADTWQAWGYVGGSHIRGSAEAIDAVQTAAGHYYQRPDADHLEYDPARTSLSGAVAQVMLYRIAGDDPWRGGLGGHVRTPGLELNDAGFQQGADEALVFGNLRYEGFRPGPAFRYWNVGINPSTGWTLGGERIWSQVNLFGGGELHSLWSIWFWGSRRFGGTSPGATRGGPALRASGGWQGSLSVNSDRRASVSLNLSVSGGVEDGSDGWNAGIFPTVQFRPSGRLSLSLSPGLSWNRSAWQYVAQPVDAEGRARYVFAGLDQTTVRLTTRLNYTLTPALSLELYAQPFVSGGDYDGFLEVADPDAGAFGDRFRPLDVVASGVLRTVDADGDGVEDFAFEDPSFRFRQMRGNAVLRWEYRPGSTLYLVWGQQRTAYDTGVGGEPGFELDRDVRRLLNRDSRYGTPVTNVFLIKVNRWLSL